MTKTLIKEFVHTRVGDILLSPSAFRRIYEEEKAAGNNVTWLPGLVLMQLEDGEVHHVWKDGNIVVQIYAYTDQKEALRHVV
ncbi:hypothetical protein [Aneurinibacillus danicus]|uniref:Uncharacterized protein n=1 Tax=Aneurinibacillus danicus TaxID=267746 RepID=A0A511V841_9BACL|nr:hypothetical protein [Aneurinibacillus danicus]GEN35107.1 hypothetical protein ADA01nite_25670 [Aneurinibacillus danicus]